MANVRQSSGTLRGEQRDPAATDNISDHGGDGAGTGNALEPVVVGGPSPHSVSVLVEPRLITEADLLWVVWLGRKRYPKNYDPPGAEGWLRNIVLKQPLMFLAQRTPNAFAVSMISVKPWTPSELECHVAALCADDGCMFEALKLLRWSIEWAKLRKCSVWSITSDTDYDFELLARRMGAVDISPRYILRL
jgi:hypothetical protein